MAQQARPKVIGQRLDLRAQFTTLSTLVKTRLSPKRFWMTPVISVMPPLPACASERAILGAHPLEVALAPDVRERHRQDRDEDEPFQEHQRTRVAQLAEDDGPGQQEDRFHVEDDEEQRKDVEADVELHPGRAGRVLAALVGGQLL